MKTYKKLFLAFTLLSAAPLLEAKDCKASGCSKKTMTKKDEKKKKKRTSKKELTKKKSTTAKKHKKKTSIKTEMKKQ